MARLVLCPSADGQLAIPEEGVDPCPFPFNSTRNPSQGTKHEIHPVERLPFCRHHRRAVRRLGLRAVAIPDRRALRDLGTRGRCCSGYCHGVGVAALQSGTDLGWAHLYGRGRGVYLARCTSGGRSGFRLASAQHGRVAHTGVLSRRAAGPIQEQQYLLR